MTPPNALAKLQVRVGDIPLLLDAVEDRLVGWEMMESCLDENCAACAATEGALLRMRDTLLAHAPKVEVEWS